MTEGRTRWLLAVVGAILAVALVVIAQPARIADLVTRADGMGLALAFAGCVLTSALRGVRLAVMLHPRIPARRAFAAVAVSQFAAATLPVRLGELAFVPLLARAGMPGTVTALSWLVLLRALDIAAFVVWAAAAAVWQGASITAGVAALAGGTLAAVLALRSGGALLGRLARRLRHRRVRTRAALRQALAVRREFLRLGRAPWRAVVVVASSLAAWGAIWATSIAALRAIGLAWPARTVLTGVIGASLGASVPLNVFGSFGTLEAGWTAALAASGVAPRDALAPGFVIHAWALVCYGVIAIAGFAVLARSKGTEKASRAR